MMDDLDQILDECIDRINRGDSLADCLADYPAYAERLEPLLQSMRGVQQVYGSKTSVDTKRKARQKFYEALEKRRQIMPNIAFFKSLSRPVTWATVAILVLAIIGTVVARPLFNPPTLVLYLADAPVDAANVTGVYIKINEIQYNLNDNWETFEDFEGPQTYNLLELSGGQSALLGEFEMSAGQYTQIRFILDIPEQGPNPTSPGCYIEFADETTAPLFVPSGGSSGYKAVGAFEVPVNGTVEVTADFDVRKAVVETGQSERYILKPTIRLIVNNQAGGISGSITNSTDYTDIVVYAYENGTWSDTEDDEPSGQETRFPLAITSGKMSAEGNYTLPLLAEGTYDLVVAGFNGGDFGEVLGFVSGVEVRSEQSTTQHIDTTTLETSL